ncbi:MAG: creatininase family protein [Acidobacteria bacterium]|nr:creatininase family protein [Acidobacteriota bacterium]
MPVVIRRCMCVFVFIVFIAFCAALTSHTAAAQTPQKPYAPGSSPTAGNPDPNTPRTLDALDSVFIEELTWLEVRDAIKAGKKTVIVASSGIEQSGPYLAVGKHTYIIRATAEAIARQLGQCLVAPIITLVPEGNFDPPSSGMRYPGTVGVSVDTFKRVVADVATAMRTNGFERIVLIGDHGSTPTPMKEVAADLSSKWTDGKTKIQYVAEYYDYPGLSKWAAETLGIKEDDEGIHDNYVITAMMAAVDPTTVRATQRAAKNMFVINTVPLAPVAKTVANGKKLIEHVATVTVAAINKAFGQPGK